MKRTIWNISNSLFYATSCLYLFSVLIGTANADRFFFINITAFQSLIRNIVFVCLIILFFLKHRYLKLKSLILVSLIVILLGIVYFKIDDATMVLTVFFILCAKNISIKKIAIYSYRTILVTTVLIIGMWLMGFFPDVFVARSGSTRMGHSLGFLGANALASTIFIGLVYYVYAKKEVWNKPKYIIYSGIALLSFIVTKSRMTFLLEILLLILLFFLQKFKSKNLLFKIQAYSYLGISILTFVLVKWYEINPNGMVQNIANLFTTGRLYWCYYFLKTYGISILGQEVNLVGTKVAALTGSNWQSIDNAYAFLAIRYGVVVLAIFCVSCIFLGNYLKKKNDYIGSLCVLILAFWGLTENSIIIIGYNIGLYMLGDMLWNKNRNYILNWRKSTKGIFN